MAFTQLTETEAIAWLRQKTRTSTANVGEWTDAVLRDYLNSAIREIATTLMVTPWAPYLLKTSSPTKPAAGAITQVEVSSSDYDPIKVAYVAYADGRVIPPMGLNRFIFETTYNNVSTGSADDQQGIPGIGEPYYLVYSDTTPKLMLRIYNCENEDINVHFYAMPPELTTGSDTVDLPAIGLNAMLSYALMLCLEDERDSQTLAVVAQRHQREIMSLLGSSPMAYDMPENAGNPAAQGYS